MLNKKLYSICEFNLFYIISHLHKVDGNFFKTSNKCRSHCKLKKNHSTTIIGVFYNEQFAIVNLYVSSNSTSNILFLLDSKINIFF